MAKCGDVHGLENNSLVNTHPPTHTKYKDEGMDAPNAGMKKKLVKVD